MKTPLIEIQDLTVSFNLSGLPVVKNVSFTIERGQRVGIVGESGSGKTLTALSLIGLMPDSAISTGKILFHKKDGEKVDLSQLDSKRIRHFRGNSIGMIFQEPMSSLNPAMRCGPQVAEMLMEHTDMGSKEVKEKVIRLFEEVDLPRPSGLYKSYPHQLSGGQRQRVMIAMAIACKPDLIIADEPTTALDVTVQKKILELLKNLSEKHSISILFISHDLGVIANIAEKLLVMFKGEIVEQGESNIIINNPKHPYTRGLLACRPPLSGKPHRLPTLGNYMTATDSGKEMKPKEVAVKNKKAKPSELLLKVSGLTTSFPLKRNIFGKTIKEIEVVKEVSFELFKGETLGLVGESGCGKTSLGRSLLQLIQTGKGEISYRDIKVNELSPGALRKFRKNLQLIFQDPYSSLNPGLTAGEAIMEPMIVHGLHSNKKQRKEKVLELLEKVSLEPDHYYRYPHQFSGGQRQRIGIARALAVEPEMIICDESVSSLDVSVQAQVLNLLNELKEEFGLTYLFISHDLAVVRYMSDRLMVMQNGRIVETGDSDEVFTNPKKEYTKRLMDAVPRIDKD